MPTRQQLESALINADKAGDTQAATQLANALKSGQFEEPSFMGAGAIEPALAVASSIPATILSGIEGARVAATEGLDKGVAAQQGIASGLSFTPRTQAGKEGLETLGKIVEFGIDVANVPISGLAGMIQMATGGTLDEAVSTINAIQREGLGETLGGKTFEATDNPELATLAQILPDAALEVIGLKGAGKAISSGGKAAEAAKAPIQETARTTGEVIEAAKGFQAPRKQDLARQIEEGTDFAEAAQFKLAKPSEGEPTTGIERFFDTKGPKIAKDSLASEAVKQGFKEGVIQPLKRSTPNDKQAMTRMVNIAERSKKDELFGLENRPGDVVGDILMDKVRVIQSANKRAGKEIDKVANKLRTRSLDLSPAGDTFIQELLDMDIKIQDGKLSFKGSDIEGVKGAENALSKIFDRMTGTKVPNAYDAHKLKRFIDEQVTYGKNAEGLAGQSERVLKKLRAKLDGLLDSNFPDYDAANTAYAETIQALDSIQDVAGRKMDLTGPNADKATGTLMRRLMSNAQSRITLLDSLDEIEVIAKRHGGLTNRLKLEGSKKDNIKMLVLFDDELDSRFGPAARTSLQGQFDQSIGRAFDAVTTKSGAIDATLGAAGKIAERARGINDENAFKAIRKLLKEGDK